MADTGAPWFITLMNDNERFPYATFNDAILALTGGAGAAAWVAWTPTWTNLTLGNGVVVARYIKLGKLTVCRLSLVFGTTTSVAGDIQFSLPVTRVAYAGAAALTPLGTSRLFDTSAGVVLPGDVVTFSTTVSAVRYHAVSGSNVIQGVTSATAPFTWATGDEIAAQLRYEAA